MMRYRKKAIILLSLALLASCKDMGNAPLPPVLSLALSSVTVAVGDSTLVEITGGVQPYRVASVSDPSKLSASIVATKLKLRALAAGSASVVVADNGSPAQSVTLTVTVVLLSVGQNSFNLFAGDSATTTISGGSPPYSLISKGDTTKVVPSISGATLKVRALAAGSSTIVIGDNSSPQLSVSVTVTVAARVSFSANVQPIFTNRCVNQGCHPGGSAPFPLASGPSYANLVNVQATSSCTSDKRVLPGNAASSVLYRKISGTTCGNQMPLGLSPLPQAEIDLIRDWINQGALNN